MLQNLQLHLTITLGATLAVLGTAHAHPTHPARPSTAAAASAGNLVIVLDVPVADAPERVCVLSQMSCKDPAEPSCLTRPIAELIASGAIARNPDGSYRPVAPPPTAKLEPTILAAFGAFGRPVDDHCDGYAHEACRPAIRLSATEIGPAHFVTCSGPTAGGRAQQVAFIGVTFNDSSGAPAVETVTLKGTTASVAFANAVAANKVVFAQVLGGDYAPDGKSEVAIGGMAVVNLHPRCSKVLAELPSDVSRYAKVTLELGRDRAVPESPPPSCTPRSTVPRVLPIAIPYRVGAELKTLQARQRADGRGTVLEASWTEAMPPSPLVLGARSIELKWKRPRGCMADRWSESTPGYYRSTWNRFCPRATLVATGNRCELMSSEAKTVWTCAYRCSVPDDLPAQALPLDIEFERLRIDPNLHYAKNRRTLQLSGLDPDAFAPIDAELPPRPKESESVHRVLRALVDPGSEIVVYRWRDRLAFPGQELTSSVAPADRRLMVEFANGALETWRDGRGDSLDGIRFVNQAGEWNQIDLTSNRARSGLPPQWTSFPAAGMTCPAQVRLAVFGTRIYREHTLPVQDGRVLLGPRMRYAAWATSYAQGGVGLTYVGAGAGHLQAGLGLEFLPHGPFSITTDFQIQIAANDYRAVLGADGTREISVVPYWRTGFRLGAELWPVTWLHVGVNAGFWFSATVHDTDRTKVGEAQKSWTIEAPMTVGRGRTVAIIALGRRLGETHYLQVDGGKPIRDPDTGARGYVTFGARVRL